MSKITTGFVGIIAVLVVATGIGFALFSSTATVTGLDLVAASPGLMISADGETFNTTLDFDAMDVFAPLVPGEYDWGEFWLENDSDGTTDPVDFYITGQLMSASGNFEDLKDLVKLRFCVYDPVADLHCDVGQATNWYTLAQWNNNPKDIEPDLMQGDVVHYAINLMLDPSAGNEIAGMTIEDIQFDFVGTQMTEEL